MKENQISMKKIMLTMVCVCLVLLSLSFPTIAQEGKTYIFDETGYFGDALVQVNQQASELSDRLGVQITFLVTPTTDDQIDVYADTAYKKEFGDADGIMLIYSEDESLWWVGKYGAMQDAITEDDEYAMWDALCMGTYYDEAATHYLDKTEELLVQKGYGAGTETISTEATDTETQENVIPVERQLPRLVDEANLLTDEEEKVLLQKLDEISERQQCDVAVVTVNSLEGKTATAFADDFYDYNGYGYGDADDGIMLVISMEDRDWAITTYAFGITAFTDAGQKYIVDKFKPSLSNGDYDEAFTKFADLCDEFITQAKTGEPYDVGNLPKGKVHWVWLPIDLAMGCIAALVIAMIKKSSLKTIVKKNSANTYVVPGSVILLQRSERLYNTRMTSTTISRSSSSSRGGSSTHTSSSGRTHGGSSGKF